MPIHLYIFIGKNDDYLNDSDRRKKNRTIFAKNKNQKKKILLIDTLICFYHNFELCIDCNTVRFNLWLRKVEKSFK